jgi:predicted acetyltransferase
VAPRTEFDDDRYELRRSRPSLGADGKPDAATLAYIDSVSLGFHEGTPTDPRVSTQVAQMVEDGVEFLGVHLRDPLPGSLDAAGPVGTYSWLRKPLSWGDGTEIDTFAITSVTVRPTERRRGILRKMMTEALAIAVADGYPMASLTASEGTIYRRFGFGPAIRERVIEIQRDRAVPVTVPADSGTVTVVPPSYLADGVGRAVYDRFHARTMGSMARNLGSWPRLFGTVDYKGEPERGVRAAVHHVGDDVDGYVTYRVTEDSGDSAHVDVVDLVYATDAAYVGLWDYLLSIDLNRSVKYPMARIDDPIVHAIADNRAFDVVHEEDHVWLRVLDPVAVLESRPWAHDGELTIRLADSLGYAAGVFRLSVSGGSGSVTRVPDDSGAELAMDVATLGQLLLGAVDPVVLAGIGFVEADHPAAPGLLRRMLQPARPPHGIAYF